MEKETTKVTVSDIFLNVTKSGVGPEMILLHGNGEDHHIFDVLVDELTSHYTVYAVDSRNHGESSKTSDYSYETMAEDIENLIGELGLVQPHIVGFSDGAIIGLILVLKDQSLVDKLVLLGVNLSPNDFKEENLASLEEKYSETKDPLFKLMLEEPNISLETLKTVLNPTLVIVGENDVFKPEATRKVADSLPNGCLKIIKGHGHDTYVSDSKVLAPILIEFLGG